MMQAKAQGQNHPMAFRTPQDQVLDYEAYYSYGSEHNTASANYRPRNSNTMLRKPKSGSKRKTTSKKMKPPQPESSEQLMDP